MQGAELGQDNEIEINVSDGQDLIAIVDTWTGKLQKNCSYLWYIHHGYIFLSINQSCK